MKLGPTPEAVFRTASSVHRLQSAPAERDPGGPSAPGRTVPTGAGGGAAHVTRAANHGPRREGACPPEQRAGEREDRGTAAQRGTSLSKGCPSAEGRGWQRRRDRGEGHRWRGDGGKRVTSCQGNGVTGGGMTARDHPEATGRMPVEGRCDNRGD